jgi:hypothetical protein
MIENAPISDSTQITAQDLAAARAMVKAMATGLEANPPAGLEASYVRGFFRRQRAALEALAAQLLAERRARSQATPGLTRAKERAEANLKAMGVLAGLNGRKATAAQRRTLQAYSGWGGLSIKRYQDQFPAGLDVDPRALIDEFYTPVALTDEVGHLVRLLLPTLPKIDGELRALEPSAGIGRFIRSAPGGLVWSAAEFSEISAGILGAMLPKVTLHQGPFEQAFRDTGPYSLVLSNPPYGERGALRQDDPRFKTVKRAQHYFLLRGLAELAQGGLGVFLIPRGFMDGTGTPAIRLRKRVLLEHHLVDAWRLPSDLFPGAKVVTDLVILRARGGKLPAIDDADVSVVDGQWFLDNPHRILGEEVRGKGRFGYEVRGAFTSLGITDLASWAMRPMCSTCVTEHTAPKAKAKTAAKPVDPTSPEGQAIALGHRVSAYLTLVAKPETAQTGADLHLELLDAVEAWISAYGAPDRFKGLRGRRKDPGVAALLSVTSGRSVLPALKTPAHTAPIQIQGSLSETAAYLYARQGRLTVQDLVQAKAGTRADVLRDLVGQGWMLDAEDPARAAKPCAWSLLVPEPQYVAGDLWPRHDRLAELQGDSPEAQIAASQLAMLRKRIGPVSVADIQGLTPRASWLPLKVVRAWLRDDAGMPVALERRGGLLQIKGESYRSLRNTEKAREDSGWTERVLSFLGWANHDLSLFKPPRSKRGDGTMEPLDATRLRRAHQWRDSFSTWLDAHPDAAEVVEHAYNRAYRGWGGLPVYDSKWEAAARWETITPHDYQAATINRMVAQGRGLIAHDVGLGKTYQLLAILSELRQKGLARRPVLAVPNSLAFKWTRDVATVLPDYKVVVIGAKLTRGRGGVERAKTDTARERGQKWAAFKAGLYDLAIITYSVLPRTRMSEDAVAELAGQLEQVQREVTLRKRALADKQKRAEDSTRKKKAPKLTERESAILTEGVKGFVADKLTLPPGQDFDAGITWDELGVDWLGVDESQNFKNLFLIEPREGGVPDYMGNPGDGAQRAWALFFRAAAVRERNGGGGVYLLSATPAKNSPLELYNALLYVAPDLLQRAGLSSSEHFVDRFCRLESREIEDVTGKLKVRQACVAFTNLPELRDLLFQVADYKTAADVGLPLPNPRTHLVSVEPDPKTRVVLADTIAEIEDVEDQRSKLLQQGVGKENPGLINALGLRILGLKMRLSMLGIHPELPRSVREGEDAPKRKRAGRPDKDAAVLEIARERPGLGKIGEVVRRVMQRRDCGHIVFCDYLAAHIWLRAALVEAGMPLERIAILNAPMVPDTNKRQRIAEQFNGTGSPGEPEYKAAAFDVIIANAVAYEGVDLQRRTCAIHHLDLPWEPATVRQRNGRGVRQGNKLGQVDLYYYLGLGTPDRMRLDKIRGKARWMDDLRDSSVAETSNPAAALDDDGYDEFLASHSRDPARARARLEARRGAQRELARARREKGLRALLKGAAGLFARARLLEERPKLSAEDRDKLVGLRAEAEKRLQQVIVAPPSDFPWGSGPKGVAAMARTVGMVVPTETGQVVLFEGMCIRPEGQSVLRFGRIGKNHLGIPAIGWTRGDAAAWRSADLTRLSSFLGNGDATPESRLDCPPPALENRVHAVDRALMRQKLRGLNLHLADDQWLTWWWPAIAEALPETWYGYLDLQVPVRTDAGTQLVKPQRHDSLKGAWVYPPTRAGFQQWLEHLPATDIKWAAARTATRAWWGRSLPRGLFKERS